jgi:general secretion pathway protein E
MDSTSSLPLASGFSREYLLYHRVCPLSLAADGVLEVAVGPNTVSDALDDLALAYRRAIKPCAVPDEDLDRRIERLTSVANGGVELTRADATEDDATADVRQIASQPPVVRYVNLLVRDAFESAASDIHIESTREGLAVRFRLDGILTPAVPPHGPLQHAVTSRIKLLAELDIAERRRPQDGRIRVRLESRDLDIRVSTVPTMFGESMVLRLLDAGGRPVLLSELGMAPDVLALVKRITARPHGMILVTGPTGSGKTTTLYAALLERDLDREKVLTVEDPIEYELARITQVPVHRQAGVTFASALRALLRQDPDVILIGEMRDRETAEIGVQAAMTGHLVFSSLHTNDAISAVDRLRDLGVPVFLIAATLEGVLAQRLVRRVCDQCRVACEPSPEALRRVGRAASQTTFQRGAGCAACRGTGYRGRTGIFEFLQLTDELKAAIIDEEPTQTLRDIASRQSMTPLLQDGIEKASRGVTTVEEVLRVAED